MRAVSTSSFSSTCTSCCGGFRSDRGGGVYVAGVSTKSNCGCPSCGSPFPRPAPAARAALRAAVAAAAAAARPPAWDTGAPSAPASGIGAAACDSTAGAASASRAAAAARRSFCRRATSRRSLSLRRASRWRTQASQTPRRSAMPRRHTIRAASTMEARVTTRRLVASRAAATTRAPQRLSGRIRRCANEAPNQPPAGRVSGPTPPSRTRCREAAADSTRSAEPNARDKARPLRRQKISKPNRSISGGAAQAA